MKKFIGLTAALVVAIVAVQYLRVAPTVPPPNSGGLRIVSLAPNLTEIVFALGAGGQLVGVTNYCTYPPQAQKKEKIGDFVNPNFEKIVSLEPDLVLAEQWTSSKTVPRLRQLAIKVVETLSPKSLAEIYGVIRDIGTALKSLERAQVLIQEMQAQVGAIEERGKRFGRRPTLYIEIDLPSWTVGQNSFISEAVYLCGARNVFEDIEIPALQVSKETVIERNPDVILSFEATSQEIRQRPGWNQIRAVQNGEIIDDVNRDLLSHGNHRLVEGMKELQARLAKMIGTKKQ